MDNNSYDEEFNEDDDLYYEDLEYDDDYEYEYQDEYEDVDSEEKVNENDNYVDEYEEKLEADDDYIDEYEEESVKTKKKYYLRNNVKVILVVLLIIILFIIGILIINSLKSKSVKQYNKEEIKVIKKVDVDDKKFDNMFVLMKDASLSYFNDSNNTDKLTLSKMNELELIKDIDSNYDINNSNASILNDNLEINVKYKDINKTKTYIIGNYIYCKDTYYCEKSVDLENKEYEYSKEGEKHLSEWSSWSKVTETSCDTKKIICSENDFSCLSEVKVDVKINEDMKEMIYQTSRNAFTTLDKEIKLVCKEYDYIKINGIYYRTEKNSNFRYLGAIKKDTQSDYYNFKYNGRKKYYLPPSDTINTRYVFVKEDYSNCKDTCSTHPEYYYDSYTFTKPLIQVSDLKKDCNVIINKVVPNYNIEQQKVTVSRKEKVKSSTCYQSVRKRQITQDENDIKWGKYNDKELLDSGYKYTGEYK